MNKNRCLKNRWNYVLLNNVPTLISIHLATGQNFEHAREKKKYVQQLGQFILCWHEIYPHSMAHIITARINKENLGTLFSNLLELFTYLEYTVFHTYFSYCSCNYKKHTWSIKEIFYQYQESISFFYKIAGCRNSHCRNAQMHQTCLR